MRSLRGFAAPRRRRAWRAPAAWAGIAGVALLVASCGREPTGLAGGAFAHAVLDVGPLFQTSASASGDDVTEIRVAVYVVNPAAAVGSAARRKLLKEYRFSASDSRSVTEDDANVTIKVEFPLVGGSAVYEVEGGAYDKAGVKLYDVPAVQFTEKQVSSGGSVQVTSTAVYVGPGAEAVKITISPRSLSLKPGEAATLTATATTADGKPVAKAPIRWRSSNGSVVGVENDRTGAIRANSPGTATISVDIEGVAGVTDAIPVTVTATPTGIQLVSGGGQTATAGDQLAAPVRVRVVSTNNFPAAGVAVTFSPAQGGSVSTASTVTDAAGEAETRWRLGGTPGQQTLTVSAAGFQITVSATATAPPTGVRFVNIPAQLATGQSGTVVVEVTQNGAPVGGLSVSFNSGGASPGFSAATATTNTLGQATASFSASAAGTYTVAVTVSQGGQVVASTSGAITVVASNVVTQLVKVSGDAQAVQVGKALDAPLVVRALNAAGQGVAGAEIELDAPGISKTVFKTESDGRLSVVLSGTSVGNVTVTMTVVANRSLSVTFSLVVLP